MKKTQRNIKSYFRPLIWTMAVCASILLVSCGDDSTSEEPEEKTLDEIAKWMDGRLTKEYYWLDEYNEKHAQFDLSLAWDKFLSNTLKKLKTNTDDGGIEADGSRRFYTSVTRKKDTSTKATTRASFPTIDGFGIEIHPYVVRLTGFDGYTQDDIGFLIDHTYPGSAAAEAGLRRGDVILQVDGKKATVQTYAETWEKLQYGDSGSIKITAEVFNDQTQKGEIKEFEFAASAFEYNPVAYSDVITMPEDFDTKGKKIGYLSYLSFDVDFDTALIDAITDLSQQGVTDMILDLRVNGGGDVVASVLLASMLLDESYVGPGKIYARLKHNPANKINNDEELTLQNRYTPKGASASIDIPNIGIKKLWVICSEFSASASEMVIVGLRGLDVEVELIGTLTEGKNCGMEVTSKTYDGYKYEFAPITFMNENGKGFADYGDGIVPETDLAAKAQDKSLDKDLQDECAYFPLPTTAWGNYNYDIALAETIMQIYDKSIFTSSAKAFTPRKATTRAENSTRLERTSLKVERDDLSSRGLFIYTDEIE